MVDLTESLNLISPESSSETGPEVDSLWTPERVQDPSGCPSVSMCDLSRHHSCCLHVIKTFGCKTLEKRGETHLRSVQQLSSVWRQETRERRSGRDQAEGGGGVPSLDQQMDSTQTGSAGKILHQPHQLFLLQTEIHHGELSLAELSLI